ncbi:uncharacterized protein LOC117178581 [Belonocnema kinseyi]|uniref:uncharacterized protein LOC117178581 n=1 Tax=Belonocnema kinseyi TaxID=2817044 RepID=UPI00143DCDFC|nr:uncharacterized protein LOC117178581 [Belonocnema kinseyi]
MSRHVSSSVGIFSAPSKRFEHIHMDLVGPLPSSNRYHNCLTFVDRFLHWPEAYPVDNMNADTIARTLFTQWIARFGVPLRITTDQVERFHRQFKEAIKCHADERWTETLPIVLLGIRAAWRDDLKSSAAELVFGESLGLPGEFLAPRSGTDDKVTTQFVEDMKRCLYNGPYAVNSRSDKTFKVNVNGKDVTLSIDRLKPAYIIAEEELQEQVTPIPRREKLTHKIQEKTFNNTGTTTSRTSSIVFPGLMMAVEITTHEYRREVVRKGVKEGTPVDSINKNSRISMNIYYQYFTAI